MNSSTTPQLSFSQLNEQMSAQIETVHKIKHFLDDSGISLDDFLLILKTYPAPKRSAVAVAAVAKAPAKKTRAKRKAAPKKPATKKKTLKNTGVNYKAKNPFLYMKDGKGYRGKGAKPKWVVELEAAGGDLEQYRIAK